MIVAFVLGTQLESIHAAEDANADEVVSRWTSTAASVNAFQIHLRGNERHRSDKLDADGDASEISTDFELKYTYMRNVGERYSRQGQMIAPSGFHVSTPTGLLSHHETRVTKDGESRQLVVGDRTAAYEYDQFNLQPGKPVREPVLQPLRNLLDLSSSGKGTFFPGRTFERLPDGESEIEGIVCGVVESPELRGARIWYDPDQPHRIRKMDLEYSAADQTGHLEYLLKYGPLSSSSLDQFEFPTGWTVKIFDPAGHVRCFMNCDVVSALLNPAINDDEFDLAIPAGAIVSDDRQQPSRFYVQGANGHQQELDPASMNRIALFRLSAATPGSRIENQTVQDETSHIRRGSWRTVLLWNAVLLPVVAGGFFIQRRIRSKRDAA